MSFQDNESAESKIARKIVRERFEKFGTNHEVVLPECALEFMTLDQLRDYVTFFRELRYYYSGLYPEMIHGLTEGATRAISKDLNNEFNRRMGPVFTAFYNYVDDLRKIEKLEGELRYGLMSRGYQPHKEREICRTADRALEFYKCRNLSVDDSIQPEMYKEHKLDFVDIIVLEAIYVGPNWYIPDIDSDGYESEENLVPRLLLGYEKELKGLSRLQDLSTNEF